MQTAAVRSQDLDRNIKKVFQTALEGTAEMASIHTQNLDANARVANDLQESLYHLKQVDVLELVSMISQIHGQLVRAVHLIKLFS